MLYFSEKWATVELEGLIGGLTIVSQGRHKAPLILAYAIDADQGIWNYEIFTPKKLTLADLSEEPRKILKARSNQKAVDLINADSDAGTADILSDLAVGNPAGSKQCQTIFKGHWATALCVSGFRSATTAAYLRRFLREVAVEVMQEAVWAK